MPPKKIFFICFFIIFTLNIGVFSQTLVNETEDNIELQEVLQYFKESGDKEKYQAALFLIENMYIHSATNFTWNDVKGNAIDFITTEYQDIEEAKQEFNNLKDSIRIIPRKIITDDTSIITKEFLIENIELAFKVWKENPWSQSYNFETFCEYILPYRSLIEPLEDWRYEYQLVFERLSTELSDKTDPVELCSNIINDIEHFDFVMRRFDPKPLLGPLELLFWREGNCPDLANVSLFANRALGVAVTFDFTPHFAASSNRHYWNTVIDKDGYHIPFNGNQVLPYIYNATYRRMGKVFRMTYSAQENNLPFIINEREIPDAFLKHKNMIDVTSEYVDVSDLNYVFNKTSTTKIGYLNVYNKGAWKPIHWSRIKNTKSDFKDMGRDIVYLPSLFNNGRMLYEKQPILLDKNGDTTVLKPDFSDTFSASLSRSNERQTTYDDNNPFAIFKDEKYKLFVWNEKWMLVETQTAETDDLIQFNNIPKNGLYLMLPIKPDSFERIFIIDNTTNEIIWY